MSRIYVLHKVCGGPALDEDDIHPDHPPGFLTNEAFSFTCLTCLDEITDPSELATTELLSQ